MLIISSSGSINAWKKHYCLHKSQCQPIYNLLNVNNKERKKKLFEKKIITFHQINCVNQVLFNM